MSLKINIRTLDELNDLEKLGLQSFSYSRLNTFDWCPAQYFFSYITKYPQEFGDKALLGNMIHLAIELTLKHGEVLDRGEMLDNYRAAREEYDPEYKIVSDELYATGVDMLDALISRQAGAPSQITSSELPFEFVFAGVLFRGFIDKVFISDKTCSLIDFKSGKIEVPDKDVPTNLQLGIYALYLKYLYPEKIITAGLHYLKSDKIKKYTFLDQDFIDIQERLGAAVENVRETTNFLPTKDRWKCKMCTYAKQGQCGTGVNILNKANKSSRYISEHK